MKKSITVTTEMIFSEDDIEIDMKTNNVPETLILETLNMMVRTLAQKIVTEANDFHEGEMDREKYLDARIKVDQEKLDEMLKN